eukprot:TRINITY_DN1269_c0_g1_i2.p1 TRINITY_DN1269_c0_g1~~TRINITY_DN1269_c0_g1_i2.p1  ORF type:complete len:801 (-),score=145.63 TRINITY_DN1269_c0_g1_i2:95-2407(-)
MSPFFLVACTATIGLDFARGGRLIDVDDADLFDPDGEFEHEKRSIVDGARADTLPAGYLTRGGGSLMSLDTMSDNVTTSLVAAVLASNETSAVHAGQPFPASNISVVFAAEAAAPLKTAGAADSPLATALTVAVENLNRTSLDTAAATGAAANASAWVRFGTNSSNNTTENASSGTGNGTISNLSSIMVNSSQMTVGSRAGMNSTGNIDATKGSDAPLVSNNATAFASTRDNLTGESPVSVLAGVNNTSNSTNTSDNSSLRNISQNVSIESTNATMLGKLTASSESASSVITSNTNSSTAPAGTVPTNASSPGNASSSASASAALFTNASVVETGSAGNGPVIASPPAVGLLSSFEGVAEVSFSSGAEDDEPALVFQSGFAVSSGNVSSAVVSTTLLSNATTNASLSNATTNASFSAEASTSATSLALGSSSDNASSPIASSTNSSAAPATNVSSANVSATDSAIHLHAGSTAFSSAGSSVVAAGSSGNATVIAGLPVAASFLSMSEGVASVSALVSRGGGAEDDEPTFFFHSGKPLSSEHASSEQASPSANASVNRTAEGEGNLSLSAAILENVNTSAGNTTENASPLAMPRVAPALLAMSRSVGRAKPKLRTSVRGLRDDGRVHEPAVSRDDLGDDDYEQPLVDTDVTTGSTRSSLTSKSHAGSFAAHGTSSLSSESIADRAKLSGESFVPIATHRPSFHITNSSKASFKSKASKATTEIPHTSADEGSQEASTATIMEEDASMDGETNDFDFAKQIPHGDRTNISAA